MRGLLAGVVFVSIAYTPVGAQERLSSFWYAVADIAFSPDEVGIVAFDRAFSDDAACKDWLKSEEFSKNLTDLMAYTLRGYSKGRLAGVRCVRPSSPNVGVIR
jgi:hypothetical protein